MSKAQWFIRSTKNLTEPERFRYACFLSFNSQHAAWSEDGTHIRHEENNSMGGYGFWYNGKNGPKTITLKTTGHEKSRVITCLTAKEKCCGKTICCAQKSKIINENWMNKRWLWWTEKILCRIHWRNLSWVNYDCYLEVSVQYSLKKNWVNVDLVPEKCITYIFNNPMYLHICMVGGHQVSKFFNRPNVETKGSPVVKIFSTV